MSGLVGYAKVIHEREEKVAELLDAGYTFRAIAKKLGIALSTAWRYGNLTRRPSPHAADAEPVKNQLLRWRGEPTLDAKPFSDWLNTEVMRFGSIDNAASVFGVSPRRVYFLLRPRANSRVTLDLVDRWLTAAGCPEMLNELYPLDDNIPIPYEVVV